MPNINLIAARREEKKRLERLSRHLFFGLAGSTAVFATVAVYLGARQLQARSLLADAEQKMVKLQPVLDRIDTVEKQTGELLPKVETLKNAKVNTFRWRAVLQVVSQSVPANTWLSGINTVGGSEDVSLNLDGLTASHTLVGDTMSRLNTHPLFDNVVLRGTSTEGGTDPNAPIQRVRFQISAHLRNGATGAVKDGKDGPVKEGFKARGEAVNAVSDSGAAGAAKKGASGNG